ncbi:MAG: hypothetical protein JXA09_08325 [Anaerolineae bacterium]|nr:hypothetical protein [Anaerolineae bacterium]
MSESETTQIAQQTGVDESIALSVQGENVTVSESLVGYLVGGDVSCEESLILVGNVGTLSGNAHVLLDLKSAIVAAAVEGVVIGLIVGLLRRKKG